MISECITCKLPGEICAPEADPPSCLNDIPLFKDFFSRRDLYHRVHVHVVGVRPKKDAKNSDAEISKHGLVRFGHFDPLVVAKTVGPDTGSTDYFPVGKHTFTTQKNNNAPVWDERCILIGKKGIENMNGIKISMYDGKEVDTRLMLDYAIPTTNLPPAGGAWKEFVVGAEAAEKSVNFNDLEFIFKIRVTECTDMISSKEDLLKFCTSGKIIDYSEEVIEGEIEADNALLQCWRQKGSSSSAVLWVLGRNDCFMHPHVAQELFIDKGYDFYVLNYSCNGLCRKRGWLENSFFNSHDRTGDFDLYLSQMEGSVSIMNSHKNYDKVLGYAHSTGGPLLINYLMEKGDDSFDGFIFNSIFLDPAFLGGEVAEAVMARGVSIGEKVGLVTDDTMLMKAAIPKELEETPIEYIGNKIVMDNWSSKIWSQHFFDFRCRPLYIVPKTVGFLNGITGVHDKISKRRKAKSYITLKPFVLITSRADDTLDFDETLKLVDIVGPSRCEIELRHNAHDVFLSIDKENVTMAIEMTKIWMNSTGF